MADAPAFDPSQPFEAVGASAPPPFDPSQPFDTLGSNQSTPAQTAAPDTLTDIAKSGATGVARGGIGIAGGLGDIHDLAGRAAEKLGLPATVGHAIIESLPIVGGISKVAPSSQDITQGVESVTGPLYQPQTTAGKYAETAGEFAPGMLLPGGEGSFAGKALKTVLAPALASEAAGQAFEGTAAEPYARTTAAVVGGGLASLPKRIPAAVIPSAGDIKSAASSAYDALQNAGNGIPVPPQAWNQLTTSVTDKLNTMGLREPVVPKVHATINDVLANPQIGDVSDLIVAKRAFKELANGTDSTEAKAAMTAMPMIDTQILKASPQLYGQLKEADANYASAMQDKQIQDALARGQLNATTSGTGGNLDNTIRQQFKPMVKPGDEMQGLTPDEIAQAKLVATGGSRASLTNLARLTGRLDPTSGGLAALLQFGATIPTGGANIPVALAGFAARKVAEARTAAAAQKLSNMIRSRSPLARSMPPPVAPQQGLTGLQRALANAVLAAHFGDNSSAPAVPEESQE